MTISIVSPSPKKIMSLQETQTSYYWSKCADLILRKHGKNVIFKEYINDNGTYPVALRDANANLEFGFYEGPLSTGLLSRIGLKAVEQSLPFVQLYDDARAAIGTLNYGRFLVKKIPENRWETTTPHEYIDEDPKWHAKAICTQFYPSIPDGWKVLAYGLSEAGEQLPMIISNDRLIVSGIPVFNIFGFNHAMPALSEGFYTSLSGSYQYPLECWLLEVMGVHAAQNGIELETQQYWPAGCRAALTIRHDYDRPISSAQLRDILRYYAERHIRATWFLLVNKPPPQDQINAMLALGHEVALHTISSSLDEFLDEAIRFRELCGVSAAGFTCHGGIGSRGHLALTHNQWALHAGMHYGEFIGRCRGIPHPVIWTKGGIPGFAPLLAQNCHHSLDLSTKPDGHQLVKLRADLPYVLDEGGHVTIMNHPDIHWPELRSLLDGLVLDDVWCATVAEVMDRLHGQFYCS